MKSIRIIQNVFKQNKIDMIVAHSRNLKWISIYLAEAKKRQIPLLVQSHGNNELLRVDGVSAIVENVAGLGGVTNIGVPREFSYKFTPLFNGIDLEFFNPDKAESKLSFDPNTIPFMILLPARITDIKGQIEFMKIVKKLVDCKLDMRLVLAGRHESAIYVKKLRKVVSNLGLGNIVFFPGALSQERLRDMYAKSDVVVLPSKTEGLPRVLLEAQAMKKPVVAYDVGGVSHAFINGETGLLVSPGDSRDFAEKLKILLLDEARRKVMGEHARKHAEKFGLPALAARHERWYLSALPAN